MIYKPKYPVFDAHVHILRRYYDLDGFLADCVRLYTETDVEGITSQCTSCYKDRAGQGVAQILVKLLNPGKVYINGGFAYNLAGLPFDRAGMLAQMQDMYDIGFDGLKMLEGKPTVRKETGIPLDSEIYDDAFDFCEEKGTHIVCHVADPWIFWDKEKCPPSAYTAGWAYLDDTYAGKEQLHKEVDNVLKRHPKLNITLAHFYFISYDLERLSDFMDRNPSVSLDVCPNPHLFYDMQKDLDKTRDFFIKYQDRILFGTDNSVNDNITGDEVVSSANRRNADIFRFLELSEVYTPAMWTQGPLSGIGLDGEPLKKIYKENYFRLKGPDRKIDLGKAIEFSERRLFNFEKSNMGLDGPVNQMKEVIQRLKAMG